MWVPDPALCERGGRDETPVRSHWRVTHVHTEIFGRTPVAVESRDVFSGLEVFVLVVWVKGTDLGRSWALEV